MHLRKSKKSIIYFFLLIMFGSINNMNLRNIEINKIKSINVDGFENKESRIITEKIADLRLDNIFFLEGEKIKKILETNPLVEKYNVFKNYPSSIKIFIVKTKFLAKINIDENPNTAQEFNIRSIPALMIFKNGKLEAEMMGQVPKSQLEEWIKESI